MITTINNKHKKLNVPNLRFPEFQGEWKKCTLNEVCKFHNGRAYKQTELLAAGKYRVLRVGNFFTNDSWYYSNLELEDNKYAQNGDLLYAWSASFGPRFWREEKVIFHYHIWKIDSFKNVDKNFLYHFLDLDSAKIKNEVQGGTMVHITKGDMEKRTISYPSVPEQRNIARFLFLLDERIATQNKIIDKLQSLIKGIRNDVFGKLRKSVGFNAMISDVLSYEQPQPYIVENTEYTAEGIPVLTANKAFVLGYTSEINGIYDKGDCIIFDDFTLDCKYVDFPFKVKSSAIKILTAKNKELLRYTFEFLKYLDLSTEEHKRHYIAETQNQEFILPTEQIVKTIAHIFSTLSVRMETAVKQRNVFEKQKQYLLRQMFI